MRQWSIVVGVLVSLYIAWMPPIWAQDEGTQVCREVQLAVQGEVGDETNPPYRNHGQYVSAAAHAANPALEAGEITEACHACIVSQFAESIPITNQEPCGPDPEPELCEVSGGPGWQNLVIQNVGYLNAQTGTSPQECCQECLNRFDCVAWWWLPGCFLNSEASSCSNPTVDIGNDAGIIGCQ